MKLETRQIIRLPKPFKSPVRPVRPTCFLVYYDGGLESLAALREACRQARLDTYIMAVYLDMIPLTRALGETDMMPTMEIQGILAAATVNAEMYGVSIKTTSMECHVRGPALLELAARFGNPKIFLGVEKTEIDELGPFASYVRALAPERVVLVSG